MLKSLNISYFNSVFRHSVLLCAQNKTKFVLLTLFTITIANTNTNTNTNVNTNTNRNWNTKNTNTNTKTITKRKCWLRWVKSSRLQLMLHRGIKNSVTRKNSSTAARANINFKSQGLPFAPNHFSIDWCIFKHVAYFDTCSVNAWQRSPTVNYQLVRSYFALWLVTH